MKKFKKIAALVGVFLLVGLYLSTLIFAIIDRSMAMNLLKISIASTIFVPVILYACILFYKIAHNDDSNPLD